MAPAPPGDTARERGEPGRGQRIAVRLVVPLLALLAVIVLVFWVFFDTAVVSGPSMEPTLHNGEYLLLTKGYTAPRRQEIIVFTEPDASGRPLDVIKRVVAVPGDRVYVDRGRATVNGRPEPGHPGIYADQGTYGPIEVPPGTVFVLGDNRPVSLDSRQRGPIPMSRVVGRGVAVFLPVWSVRLLPR